MAPLAAAIEADIADALAGKSGPRMTAVKWMQKLPADVVAYLTLKGALSAAITSASLTQAAHSIGTMIAEELRLCAFEEAEPGLFTTVMRQLKQRGSTSVHAHRVLIFAANKANIELPRIIRTDAVHLGMKLIDLLIAATGFVSVFHVRRGRKTTATLQPTEQVSKWINDRNFIAGILKPQLMPTVEKPREWSGLSGGGYHTDALRALQLVKRCSKEQRARLELAQLGVVFTATNAVQSTAWRINTRVLEVMATAWDNGEHAALPSREDAPVPPKPVGFVDGAPGEAAWAQVDAKERKRWRMEARRVHEANTEARGKRINIARILATAADFKDDAAIYFPHNLDFRGRMYAVPVGLHPQGPDMAKALLTFAQGKPINDERALGWLMIQGANLFGYDKASLDERIAWVDDNFDNILAVATDPCANSWWTEADSPWCFLAWCFEYTAFQEHGYGFVSSLPISVDGSCNGLQHFSAMLRDPVGGAAVNLVPGDRPSDIYQRVADRVIERLRQVRDTNAEVFNDKEAFEQNFYATGWLAFGIDRKTTKRPVMVLPYGGTFRSCMQYVREAVGEKIAAGKENPFGDELGRATAFLAKLVWESIGDVVVAARTAMDWLQKVARVATKAGLTLSWTTPSGFVAYQAYRDIKARRVKTKLQGSIIKLSVNEEGDKLDADRQALGVSPNFVHSMDAAAMMLTIEMAQHNGVTQFAMIHDSYGTVAADMDVLSTCLREAFVDMYTEHNVLKEFLDGLPEEVRAQCPPLPPFGSLDLSAVRDSAFFFA